MTEKEKMLAGIEYDANDSALSQELNETRVKVWNYNNCHPNNKQEKEVILRDILGKCGEKININQPFYCDYGKHIEVGERFFANFNLTILDEAMVRIGNDAFIGPNVNIFTAIHPIDPIQRNALIQSAKEVRIGDNVWIGGNSTILPGVTIGNNVTIGAGSVVTKNIPDNCVAAGNPAKVIRKI